MNLYLRKNNEQQIDTALAQSISQQTGLHAKLVELLISRGINSAEDIDKFMNPSIDNLHDPFVMKGMSEAVERIKSAIDNNEKVVVYGDYDADGICATSILTLHLINQGLDVYPHIPNRTGEGYGLNVESIEKIVDACCPDLIITCDCGISGHAEVEYAIDLGVDMIVTDHHEVSDLLPQCIVVNPKQSDCEYPCKGLCGAGVALKLVQALGGIDEAEKYLDLASIATIADLVPLIDENRLIVQLGLDKLAQKKNMGLKALLLDQNLNGKITSGDIAFKIAPRINAAGRMGDAYRAFELLTSSDEKRITQIITEINEDNLKRKTLCDAMYDESLEQLKSEDLSHDRAIVLSHPEWEKGITGILAARLTNDFKRPSFIMVKSNDTYKGTSRSVKDINLYELLSACSDLLIEFGGHNQAAGFSILEENIPSFKQRVNEYLAKFPFDSFLPTLEYDVEISLDEINLDFVKALEKLEPTGNSNPKPLFKLDVNRLSIAPCKNTAHTSIYADNLQIFAFNFYKQNQYLMGNESKDCIIELQYNLYNGNESVKAVLKGLAPQKLYINDDMSRANYIKMLNFKSQGATAFTQYDESDLESLVTSQYGTLIVVGCKKTYESFVSKYNLSNIVLHEFMTSTQKNNFTRVVVSPEFDENLILSLYNKIIFLDSPLSENLITFLNKNTNAEIFVPKKNNQKDFFKDIDLSREIFGKYFEALRKGASLVGNNIFGYYKLLKRNNSDLQLQQFIICVMVFADLGLITIMKNGFGVVINKDVKANLTESLLYQKIQELK